MNKKIIILLLLICAGIIGHLIYYSPTSLYVPKFEDIQIKFSNESEAVELSEKQKQELVNILAHLSIRPSAIPQRFDAANCWYISVTGNGAPYSLGMYIIPRYDFLNEREPYSCIYENNKCFMVMNPDALIDYTKRIVEYHNEAIAIANPSIVKYDIPDDNKSMTVINKYAKNAKLIEDVTVEKTRYITQVLPNEDTLTIIILENGSVYVGYLNADTQMMEEYFDGELKQVTDIGALRKQSIKK